MQPRAGQLQLAEQDAEDDGLVIFEATASAAGWAGRARGQERGDLAAEDLALELQQERLGLGQRQAQVLRPVVLLVQHNELVDGDLLVVLGDDHELKLEAQRHAGDPQRWKDPATVSARARQTEASAPGLLWPHVCQEHRIRMFPPIPRRQSYTRLSIAGNDYEPVADAVRELVAGVSRTADA